MCVCIPFQSALGWDHQSELAKHGSQIDAAKGFGGKFGVQKDHKDKVFKPSPPLSFNVPKATLFCFSLVFTLFRILCICLCLSFVSIFFFALPLLFLSVCFPHPCPPPPFSPQSALGWDYQADLSKHESQTDATKGFGGRYGVQKDRQDTVKLEHKFTA